MFASSALLTSSNCGAVAPCAMGAVTAPRKPRAKYPPSALQYKSCRSTTRVVSAPGAPTAATNWALVVVSTLTLRPKKSYESVSEPRSLMCCSHLRSSRLKMYAAPALYPLDPFEGVSVQYCPATASPPSEYSYTYLMLTAADEPVRLVLSPRIGRRLPLVSSKYPCVVESSSSRCPNL